MSYTRTLGLPGTGTFAAADPTRLTATPTVTPTTDNAALQALGAAALAAVRHRENDSAQTRLGTRTFYLPAGDFEITTVKAMLGLEGSTGQIAGLRIVGAGSDLTTIIFNPASAGALIYNDSWRNIHIEGVSFRAKAADCTFMQSYTTNAAQHYVFVDCAWYGWKYGFDLQGTDNNSEFSFYACENEAMQSNGAFFYVGSTNVSDEFVNYWWFGFKHRSTNAPMIDSSAGGHYHIYGLDASNFGSTLTGAGYLFYLRSPALVNGTRHFSVAGMRAELTNANAKLLYSAWSIGSIDMQVDMSSQINNYTYGDVITLDLDTREGPVLNVHGSSLAGGVGINYTQNSALRSSHRFTFDNCEWRQRRSPSEVVTYYPAGGTTRLSVPLVRFISCRGLDQDPATAPIGMSVWNAIIGYNTGDRVAQIEKRELRVKDYASSLATSGTTTIVTLPVGATVTGLHVIMPAGQSASSSTPTWTVTDADSTQIITAIATRTQAQGYNLRYDLAAPVLCDTQNKATLTFAASGVSSANAPDKALVILEGYW